MALNLNSLANKTAKVDVPFMGEVAKVTYDPSYITRDTLTEATTKSDEAFLEMFCTLVKDWDVTKGKTKVPLTVKALSSVPLVFLRAVFQTIMAEAGDGAADEEGKGSSGS